MKEGWRSFTRRELLRGWMSPNLLFDVLLQEKLGQPCHTLQISATEQTWQTDNRKYEKTLRIYFPQRVTRVTEKGLYNMRNLLAEIGGYVGIFWGFSLLNLADAVVSIVMKCQDSFISRKKVTHIVKTV